MANDFICGKCVENDSGLCDVLGIFVEEDDSPHCAYGKGYKNFDNIKKKDVKEDTNRGWEEA